jgi:hypothetical protein
MTIKIVELFKEELLKIFTQPKALSIGNVNHNKKKNKKMCEFKIHGLI